MITFDIKEQKVLSMPFLVEGINSGSLNFRLIVEIEGIKYGFDGKIFGDNVKFTIPPLNSIIKNIKEGTYKSYLEAYAIMEEDKGFYMRPWEDDIKVKKAISISIDSIKEENRPFTANEDTDFKVSVGKTMVEEENKKEKVDEKQEEDDDKPIKKSKFRETLFK